MRTYRIVKQGEYFYIEYKRLWWWKRHTVTLEGMGGNNVGYEPPFTIFAVAEMEVHKLLGQNTKGARYVVREYSKRYD